MKQVHPWLLPNNSIRFRIADIFVKMLFSGALFFLSNQSLAETDCQPVRMNERAKKIAQDLPDFQKVISFFQQKKWDSVLVHSNRMLSTIKNPVIKDYLHFYRGDAFLRKGILKPATKELQQVSTSFDYYFRKRLSLGEIYMKQGHYKQALNAFQEIDTNNTFQLRNIYLEGVFHNIGLCYFYLENYPKSEQYMFESIKRSERKKDFNSLVAFYTDLANLYYEQYRDDEAYVYFEKAYQLSKKHGEYEMRKIAAFNMAVFKENQKKYEEALGYRKEYEDWQDSLMDQNKIYEVAQKEKQFAVNQKKREVKLLRTENKLKQTERNLYLIAALALLIILFFGMYLYRQNLKRSRIIFNQKQELDQLNTTKDRLFSIVSHDLRSSVHALKNSNTSLLNHLATGNYSDAETQLEQNSAIATNTYNMLDNLLHWALLQIQGGYFKQETHRLGMLADQVAYNFQALLKEKKITFENKLPKRVKVFVDAESLKIVLRNLMDNSIKFSNPGAQISIELLAETETSVQWVWKDTGRGMTEEARLKLLSDSPQLTKKEHEKEIGSGLGMNLCLAMIAKNKGLLDIRSCLNEGTEFIVTLQKTEPDGRAAD